MRKTPHRPVFACQTGTTMKRTRLCEWARRGGRCKALAPFGHWDTRTFVAALRCDDASAPWSIDRPLNRRIFETRAQTRHAPTLQPGDVVILDNLSSHRSKKAEAILTEPGAWFRMLAPSSPGLDPTGMAFAKPKAHRRRSGAGTIDDLWKAVASLCCSYSDDECRNDYKAADYARYQTLDTRNCPYTPDVLEVEGV